MLNLCNMFWCLDVAFLGRSIFYSLRGGGVGSVRHKSIPVMEMNRSFVVEAMPITGMETPPTIRKEFPETWLWDTFQDRCVAFFSWKNFPNFCVMFIVLLVLRTDCYIGKMLFGFTLKNRKIAQMYNKLVIVSINYKSHH